MNLTTHKIRRAPKARLLAAILGSTVAVSSLTVMSVSAATSHSVPTLLLYNAQGYGDKVAAAFNATNPGFKIVVDDDSTGPLFTKIQAALTWAVVGFMLAVMPPRWAMTPAINGNVGPDCVGSFMPRTPAGSLASPAKVEGRVMPRAATES